jgi:hypothetical protein
MNSILEKEDYFETDQDFIKKDFDNNNINMNN